MTGDGGGNGFTRRNEVNGARTEATALKHGLRNSVGQACDRRIRVGAAGHGLAIDADRRAEGVVLHHVSQCLCRRPDRGRRVAARVEDGISSSSAKQRQIANAIAVNVFELREESRVGAPAMKQRELVAALQGCVNEVAAEETGS